MLEQLKADKVKPNYSRQEWVKLLDAYYDSTGNVKEEYLVHVNCPYCDASARKSVFVLHGFRHATCVECGTVYVTPRLKAECLSKLYSEEYYDKIYKESLIPAFETRKRLIGSRKFKQILQFAGTRGRVLDIGCGIGEVIDVFKDEGWSCEAIEVNPTAVAWLKGKEISVYEGSFAQYSETEKFDVIMAWGVVEHVVDPAEFLRKVVRHLVSGGVFVSEVPNGESLLVDYCRETLRDPGRILWGEQHIVLYTPRTYEGLHAACGLEKLHVQTNGLDVETICKIVGEPISDSTMFTLQQCIDGYFKGDLVRGFWRWPGERT